MQTRGRKPWTTEIGIQRAGRIDFCCARISDKACLEGSWTMLLEPSPVWRSFSFLFCMPLTHAGFASEYINEAEISH